MRCVFEDHRHEGDDGDVQHDQADLKGGDLDPEFIDLDWHKAEDRGENDKPFGPSFFVPEANSLDELECTVRETDEGHFLTVMVHLVRHSHEPVGNRAVGVKMDEGEQTLSPRTHIMVGHTQGQDAQGNAADAFDTDDDGNCFKTLAPHIHCLLKHMKRVSAT